MWLRKSSNSSAATLHMFDSGDTCSETGTNKTHNIDIFMLLLFISETLFYGIENTKVDSF